MISLETQITQEFRSSRKEDVELCDVGTCDKSASPDGGLLSCAAHANKVPEPGRSPRVPAEPPVL